MLRNTEKGHTWAVITEAGSVRVMVNDASKGSVDFNLTPDEAKEFALCLRRFSDDISWAKP